MGYLLYVTPPEGLGGFVCCVRDYICVIVGHENSLPIIDMPIIVVIFSCMSVVGKGAEPEHPGHPGWEAKPVRCWSAEGRVEPWASVGPKIVWCLSV